MTTKRAWNPGVADEPWKVEVCLACINRADRVLSELAYILAFGTPGGDVSAYGPLIEGFTGAEIVRAIENYRASAQVSVVNGQKAR